MSTRNNPQEKAREVEEIRSLIQEFRAIGTASLQKVRAPQLQELRRKLQDSAHLRVVKNTIMKRAIEECENKPELGKLGENLSGASIFLFTNLNPFRLALLLQKSKVETTARGGDVAAHDVTVPAGNTGLPPGPIISQLGSVGLPTRIEAGSVWISRDTLVVREGETVSARLATVLSKLGIKSVEIGLTLKTAYDDGLILSEEQLQLDLEEFRQSIQEAHAHAFNMSLNVAYPLSENIPLLLQRAHYDAWGLAMNVGMPSRDTIVHLMRKAHTEMLGLLSRCQEYSAVEGA